MDIFEFAMQMEKDGETYYRQLATGQADKGLQTILGMLADDEVRHYRVLVELRQKHHPALVMTDVLANAKNVFQQMKGEKRQWPDRPGAVEAYRKAQEIEKKSMDFYSTKADEVKEPFQRDMLLKIAAEEKRHYFLLENIIQFVSRPKTWIENAEFNHLDDY